MNDDAPAMAISEVTRRGIFDWLVLEGISWRGRLDDVEFLSRLFDLTALPSFDHRFDNAEGDIWQHRFNNDDWSEDWVYSDRRLGLVKGPDETFLRFLRETVHPIARADADEAKRMVHAYNRYLRVDGWEFVASDVISGRNVFEARRIVVGRRSPASDTVVHDRAAPRRSVVLDGRRRDYALEPKPIGAGGQAEVYRATHKPTGTVVAFKRSHPDDEARGRMRREIEIQRQCSAHCIMPILDAGDDDSTWLTMPLADGDLHRLRASVNDRELVRALDAVAQALQVAHAKGFVHRDVTPRNILALSGDAERRWVLSDWGLVRRPRGETTVLRTLAGEVLGTEGFAAPETWKRAHDVGPEADVYSLGRVAAWAATGTWPAPNLPLIPDGDWRAFVQATTAIEPTKRTATVAEVRDLLTRVLITEATPAMPNARMLAERARKGDAAAGAMLLELARERIEDEEFFLDDLEAVPAAAIAKLVVADPEHASALVTAMSDHLKRASWYGREFDSVNDHLSWLHRFARAAATARNWGVLEDASVALFEGEARWERFRQRDVSREWLRDLTGDAAGTVARALRRVPSVVRWYLEGGWRPNARDERITAALAT